VLVLFLGKYWGHYIGLQGGFIQPARLHPSRSVSLDEIHILASKWANNDLAVNTVLAKRMTARTYGELIAMPKMQALTQKGGGGSLPAN